MVDVVTAITINRPREQVSEYAAGPENAPEWYVNIKSAEWLTPKPLQIGSKIAFKAHFLGKELSYVYQITEYIPMEILVMKTADGPFPMETTYTWEPVNGSLTRMTLRNQGNPAGFSMLFAPFMSLMMKRANNKDLERIKSILEQPHS
ncbi:SRPBCC family protein [Paenibacillus sp. sptzw28]|uniref:SRPBCC family protein n=1 Tax=Paenibacillus sp. sptzw28 TaxID=715179 RepID=UPI001C6F2019|nr:SRPBCC family protein [Paenibacillus sp. sptzw28]QYR20913.1 SRPBCC family protein [Paenibacillus sp. sptzw28]